LRRLELPGARELREALRPVRGICRNEDAGAINRARGWNDLLARDTGPLPKVRIRQAKGMADVERGVLLLSLADMTKDRNVELK
jgi:hypothetical protein